MQIEIPDGAYVHVSIGRAPVLLTGPVPDAPTLPSPRRRRPLLLGASALVLCLGSYQAGKHLAPQQATIPVAYAAPAAPSPAQSGPAAPIREQVAFPDRPFPRPQAASGSPPADPTQVPPAFLQGLRDGPTVVPPPGRAAGPAAGTPFGLQP